MFGRNLRYYRKESGMSQEALSKIICISRQAIASYEANRREPNIDTIMMLSKALDAPLNQLLGGDEVIDKKLTNFAMMPPERIEKFVEHYLKMRVKGDTVRRGILRSDPMYVIIVSRAIKIHESKKSEKEAVKC